MNLGTHGLGGLLASAVLEEIGVFLEGSLLEDSGRPEIGCEVGVGVLDGIVGSLHWTDTWISKPREVNDNPTKRSSGSLP